MKTRHAIYACLAGLLDLSSCEGNTWPANAPAAGLDAAATHLARAAEPTAPDATVAVRRAVVPIDVIAIDAAIDTAVDVAVEAAAEATAPMAATVLVPVYMPFYLPSGWGSEGAPATRVETPTAPALVMPVTAAPIGTGGTLGQYGTPGTFNSTGVTAGDPGTLRGTFP